MAAVESDFPRGVNGDKNSSNPQNNAPNTACVSNLLFNYAFCSLKMLNISTGVWNDSDILHKIYSTSLFTQSSPYFFFQCCVPQQEYTAVNVSLMHMHMQLHVIKTRILMRSKLWRAWYITTLTSSCKGEQLLKTLHKENQLNNRSWDIFN